MIPMDADHDRELPNALPVVIAISWGLGAFGVWGWLAKSNIFLVSDWGDFLTHSGAGFLLYCMLSVCLQWLANLGAQAARRSLNWRKMPTFYAWSSVVVVGGMWSAVSVHNAFEQTGMIDPGSPLLAQMLPWSLSVAVAFVEIASYWGWETLRSEQDSRKCADEAATLASARGMNLTEFEERHLTDAALAAGIKAATGYKRRLEVERNRREKRNISTNS